MRPGRERDVSGSQQRGDGMPVGNETGEIYRQSSGLPLQPGPQRAVAHDDKSGLDTRTTQLGDRIDAALQQLMTINAATWSR